MSEAEFRKLIVAELDAVYRLASHLTRNAQRAEEFVQETYLRALRSASTFTPTAYGARPWLFRILHNVIYSGGSKVARERSAMDAIRQLPAISPADASGDGTSIDWENVDERLKVAVDELALPYRETFLLSAVEGLKYREIAEIIDVPVGTVMSRLSRARSTLAAKLSELAAELGYDAKLDPMNVESPPSPRSETRRE